MLKKKFYILFLILFLLLLSMSLFAEDTPLYTGKGWTIHSARSGDWLLSTYPSACKESKPFMYLAANDASTFYGFVLKIQQGAGVLITSESSISLTYIANNNILTVESTELFFFNECLTKIERITKGDYTRIPKPDRFQTPKGNPILFAKFTFKHTPRTLLYCDPNF